MGRVDDMVGGDVLVARGFLDGAEVGELRSSSPLLLLIGLLKTQNLLGSTAKLLVVKLLELGDSVVAGGVDNKDLKALLLKNFWISGTRVMYSGNGNASQLRHSTS